LLLVYQISVVIIIMCYYFIFRKIILIFVIKISFP